jgi:hypothetical protein
MRPRSQANSAANSGIEATAIAAMPEPTSVSARFTRPLDSSTMKIDSHTRVRHWRGVGGATPRQRSTAYINPPATDIRIAPSRNGG